MIVLTLVAVIFASLYLLCHFFKSSERLTITSKFTKFNSDLLVEANLVPESLAEHLEDKVIKDLPSLQTYAFPALWGWNGHLQNVYSSIIRTNPTVTYKREVIPDPNYEEPICLDWVNGSIEQGKPWDHPTIILLPGITGSIDASYVNNFVQHCAPDFRIAVYTRPGCDPKTDLVHYKFRLNSLPSTIATIIDYVDETCQKSSPLLIASFSLGGQNISKYLCEYGEKANKNIIGCLAICNPFDTNQTVENLRKYPMTDRAMATNIKNIIFRNEKVFEKWINSTSDTVTSNESASSKLTLGDLKRVNSIKDLDKVLTMKIHDMSDVVRDYYIPTSITHSMFPLIQRPIVYLHARDDPVVPDDAVPKDIDNDKVIFLTTNHGSHCSYAQKHSNFLPFLTKQESYMDRVGKDVLLAFVKLHKQAH